MKAAFRGVVSWQYRVYHDMQISSKDEGGGNLAEQDSIIVRRILAGEEAGMRLLIEEYGSMMKSIVCRYLGAYLSYRDECLDDVLLSIWEHMADYDAEISSLGNWIAGICKFKALQYIRKNKRSFAELGHDMESCMGEVLPSVEEQVFSESLPEYLEEMLGELDADSREILWQLYVEEVSVGELAAKRNKSRDAIYKKSQRARSRLRERWNRKTAFFLVL